MTSIHMRCQVVTGIFAGIILISALSVRSEFLIVQYLGAIQDGELIDEDEADELGSRQMMLGAIQTLLLVSCMIAFLMWFHRAHKNLGAAGLEDLEYSPGWAVGGFFVPFLNLVRPFQVMKEVWSGSEFLSGESREESWQAVPSGSLVGWWWGCFLISSMIGNAAARLTFGAVELEELLISSWVLLVSDLADIPAAVFGLLMVRRISGFQERARSPVEKDSFSMGADEYEDWRSGSREG